jgi:hypothetical protein
VLPTRIAPGQERTAGDCLAPQIESLPPRSGQILGGFSDHAGVMSGQPLSNRAAMCAARLKSERL